MTRGQQFVLFAIVLVLIGVIAVAVALVSQDKAASPAPVITAAILPTTAPTTPPIDTPTHAPVPTWTTEPTRTPPATNTPRPMNTATSPPAASPTFAPTFTPFPTEAVTPSLPAFTETASLQNPGFEDVDSNVIPGWEWWAKDNFTPGGEYDPDTSLDTPLFKKADDPARFITGPTLQIDAVQHLKFKVHIFQTVTVSPTTRIGFQASAGAFAEIGVIWVNAGIDPDGGPDCSDAEWSEPVALDQAQGVRTIAAPELKAGSAGRVTVCLYAEALYAAVSNAAFFDDAELILE